MLRVGVKLLVKSDWREHTPWQGTSLVLHKGVLQFQNAYRASPRSLSKDKKKKDRKVIATEKSNCGSNNQNLLALPCTPERAASENGLHRVR